MKALKYSRIQASQGYISLKIHSDCDISNDLKVSYGISCLCYGKTHACKNHVKGTKMKHKAPVLAGNIN